MATQTEQLIAAIKKETLLEISAELSKALTRMQEKYDKVITNGGPIERKGSND